MTELAQPPGRFRDTARDALGRGHTQEALAAATARLRDSRVAAWEALGDVEGLRERALVEAFVRTDALQCGFCTPGQIVSASALVASNPEPSKDEIRHAMAGNLCRCGTYPKIEEAIAWWQG